MKSNIPVKTISLAAGALLFATPAAHAESGQTMRELINDPLAWGFAFAVVFLLISLYALNKALNTVRQVTMAKLQSDKVFEGAAVTPIVEGKSIMDVLTDAKPVEREADILLDHDYDGIHELDNNLPPWWVWGFYGSIAYAVIYMIFFITGDSLNSAKEFENEMAAAQVEVDAYLATAASSVDENTVVLLADASALAAGAKIFESNCVACHLADGGGSVGPNLTDEYWIHGGGITNVFTTVKYGVPTKGMIAWKDQLNPVQMQQVASYVLSLQGTTPAVGKAPEGEIWKEEAAPATAPADTTQTDTTQTVTPQTQTTTAASL